MGRIMTPIRIHRNEHVVRSFEPPPNPINRRRTQAELARPMQNMNSRVGRRSLVAPSTRAIGRIVINDKHVCTRQHPQDFINETGKISNFVVRGQSDENPRGGH